MKTITVLIGEDHNIVSHGLRIILELEPGIQVVGEARDGHQVVLLAGELKPAVLLLDISMPLLNGLDAIRQILKVSPSTRVLMLSSHRDDAYVKNSCQAGASGFIVKQASGLDLCQAIRDVNAGKRVYSPSIARRIQRLTSEQEGKMEWTEKLPLLTLRELEVLRLIASGNANKQTALLLGIGVKTVEKHREHLMRKLDIHDTAGLTRYSVSVGLIEALSIPVEP